jgi:hypothetical protein
MPERYSYTGDFFKTVFLSRNINWQDCFTRRPVSNGLNDIADLPAVIIIAVFECGIVPGMKRVTVPRPGEIIP